MKYPEHEKLDKVKDKSQVCGEFLEFLARKYHLCTAHDHEHCESEGRGLYDCGMAEGTLVSVLPRTDDLLGEFFHIDQKKLSAEKDQMLAEIRRKQ